MAQEFTISISDALWADIKAKLSSGIDPTLTGDISVERMTTYLNMHLDFILSNRVKKVKMKEFQDSLE